MGRLVDGVWKPSSVITSDDSGRYDRVVRSFRDKIGDSSSAFPAESNRYHLYVSLACPWACRALMVRKLKSLENHISVSVVHPDMLEDGWKFDDSFPGASPDHLYGARFLRNLSKSRPES